MGGLVVIVGDSCSKGGEFEPILRQPPVIPTSKLPKLILFLAYF